MDKALQEQLMKACIADAKATGSNNSYALGALVYGNNRIIAKSGSLLNEETDPTAHPEMTVIRKAAKLVGSRYLEGCVLVSTLEPCPMCTAAAIWGKMEGVIFGASQADARAWSESHSTAGLSWRQINLQCADVAAAGNPRLWIASGVLRDECCELFDLSL